MLSINKGSLLVCHLEISQMMVHRLTLLILLESPLMGKGASRLFHNVKTMTYGLVIIEYQAIFSLKIQ